jgi:RNA polymerase sigma factor (sigma-70 family)
LADKILQVFVSLFRIVILFRSWSSRKAVGQAKEQEMSEQGDDLQAKIRAVAEKAVQAYAQGLLSLEALAERISAEWQKVRKGDEPPPREVLWRIAQRICSYELYHAWRSSDITMRNHAFYNLRQYLEQLLARSRYVSTLRDYAHAVEDVVHQTLEILLQHGNPGPNDPAAFLKWTQTILIRQARTYQQKSQLDPCVSLDSQTELFHEQLVNNSNNTDTHDPLERVLLHELREALGRAILSMRNPRYRLVLIYTFLAGVDEDEMARRLGVPVQDIYLWRHRALKALRRNPEIISILRSLLE